MRMLLTDYTANQDSAGQTKTALTLLCLSVRLLSMLRHSESLCPAGYAVCVSMCVYIFNGGLCVCGRVQLLDVGV